MSASFVVSGRTYRLPSQKTAVFCIDGCAPEYLDDALEAAVMPRLKGALGAGGVYVRALAQMPTFTNPNNLSIVTGLPPSGHGVSGNFFFDEARDEEVPMTDPRVLRAPTILEELESLGVRTLAVTAKDKLRALLGASSRGHAPTSLSAEKAHEQSVAGVAVTSLVGRKNPSIYDWDLSHYALEMGLAAARKIDARVVYVSTTDYVQHKAAPGEELARRFYARLDELLGAYLDEGFACALTADHGMNAKAQSDGSPNVRYLSDALDEAAVQGARVLLPITDPYVVHHGALGSYATVYAPPGERAKARAALAKLEGVDAVLTREEAAERFALPGDRIGDLVVLGDARTVLGKSAAYHDLGPVARGLRSHGGTHERVVPIVLFGRVSDHARARSRDALTNADVFELALSLRGA